MRTLSQVTRVLAAAASFALPAVTAAQSKPIIAVLHFDNNSIGASSKDYDGIGKGIQELLIADLAGNANYRLVERERIQAVLEEQNLAKTKAIDPATAVRVGKILGAQYVIYGGFMNAPGGAVLTAHTTDMETSQIQNPMRINGNPADVMGLISQLSTRVGALKLTAKTGGGAGGADEGGAKQSGVTKESTPVKQAEKVETFAKPIAPAAKTTKLDVATANLYASALDELDNKRPAKAAALFQQVLAKAPGFPPAEEHLKKLGKSGH